MAAAGTAQAASASGWMGQSQASATLPGTFAQRPTTLSREVLRWLQSLDLAYSIRNVKRDFSNGFLVAEIFSRYYDRDIQMHSFDNGQAVKVRKDNWKLLVKVFRRLSLSHVVTDDEINGIIYCQDSAAVAFINRIYEVLTQRKVQEVIKRPLPEAIPAYARETAVTVVGSVMKTPEVLESRDQMSVGKMLKERVGEHEKQLQEERSLEPERFAQEIKVMHPALDRKKSNLPQVKVTEIQVKQLATTNVAQLRAARDSKYGPMALANLQATHPSGGAGDYGNQDDYGRYRVPAETLPGPTQAHAPAVTEEETGPSRYTRKHTAIALMNNAVNARWNSEAVAESDKVGREPVFVFSSAVVEGQVEEDIVLDVMEEMHGQADGLSDAFLAAPVEFWKFVGVMTPLLLDLPEDSRVLLAAADVLSLVGAELLRRDTSSASNLCIDYLMPRLLPALSKEPATSGKLYQAVKLMYAYCPDDPISHYQLIKRLQAGTEDLVSFMKWLALLVLLEQRFDENLLDYYLYYAMMGLGNTHPQARGYAVAVLCTLGAQRAELVLPLTDQLLALAKDETWWEVQAQLLVLTSTMLRVEGSRADSSDGASQWLGILLEVFKPSAPVYVRKVGLSVLTPLAADSPSIQQAVVNVLLSLPTEDRTSVLGLGESPASCEVIPLVTREGLFRMKDVASEWDGLKVLEELEGFITTQALENLEQEHMQVIAAVVLSQCFCARSGTAEEEEGYPLDQQWVGHLEALRDHIFVAMCDPACCDLAIEVTRRFVLQSSLQEALLTEGSFLGTLRLLYPSDEGEVDARCQELVHDFMLELASKGEPFTSAMSQVLQTFAAERQGDSTFRRLNELLQELQS